MFPDDVETITMTRQDYDRHMENLIYENIELKQRIDKAIEYIETWCYDEYSIAIKTGDKTCSSEPKAIDKLLDILKGSDNNE
jgi:hypothetical protein